MKLAEKQYERNNLAFSIRTAEEKDAASLSNLRLQIDGETENMDREKGEAFLDEAAFKKVINEDTIANNSLFLVAETAGRLVGFSRCEGGALKRTTHRADFGICVLKEFWGYGIGTLLLKSTIEWADSIPLKKLSLSVLETNQKAISMYTKHGFEVEGILKNDKRLADGRFYSTIVMGRHHNIES
ncbi:GNAT family N-acetyltransferase [Niallia sp. FSL R7-0271]|uniref:GNAT family N-acetyltransferase n=1 Tax=Niallia sp. FSL R7-0271 TaxID=2921678 RepID=UPI0030FB786F